MFKNRSAERQNIRVSGKIYKCLLPVEHTTTCFSVLALCRLYSPPCFWRSPQRNDSCSSYQPTHCKHLNHRVIYLIIIFSVTECGWGVGITLHFHLWNYKLFIQERRNLYVSIISFNIKTRSITNANSSISSICQHTWLGIIPSATKIITITNNRDGHIVGVISPYPTVLKVTTTNHIESNKSIRYFPPLSRCCTPHILK